MNSNNSLLLHDTGVCKIYMFQISDDIMDAEQSSEHIGKTANKDQIQDKLTSQLSLFQPLTNL